MAEDREPVISTEPKNPERGRVVAEMFFTRFSAPIYRLLAEHMALAEVLTPDLASYLHSQFLTEYLEQYEAGADLLLSDLCREAGYEQYVMDADAREYLLRSFRQRPGGPDRMRQVAGVLLGYVAWLARRKGAGFDRELDNQRLAAMMYIDDERRHAVSALVHRINECFAAAGDLAPDGALQMQAEIEHIIRQIEKFARLAQLDGYEGMVEFARDVRAFLDDETGRGLDELRESGRLDRRYELPNIEVQLPSLARLVRKETQGATHENISPDRKLVDALLGRLSSREVSLLVEDLGEMAAIEVWRWMQRSEIRIVDSSLFIGDLKLSMTALRKTNRTLVEYLVTAQRSCRAVLPLENNAAYDGPVQDVLDLEKLLRSTGKQIVELQGEALMPLALSAVIRAHDAFPDGIIYIDAQNRSLHRTDTIAAISQPFMRLRFLSWQSEIVPALPELTDKNILIILDHLSPEESVEIYCVSDRAALLALRMPPAPKTDLQRRQDLIAERLAQAQSDLEVISDRMLYTRDSRELDRLRKLREDLRRRIERLEEELDALESEPEEVTEIPSTDFKFESVNFETVTLDKYGTEIERRTLSARQFIEDLGQGVTLEMVEIPGGTFLMGSPKSEAMSYDSERPQREVSVAPFFIGKFTITQEQWRIVAGWPKVDRDLKENPYHFKGERNPVERVSWHDAKEFCARLSQRTGRAYRLPSEAEWEYACRAGTTTPFAFGETITSKYVNYDGNVPYAEAQETGVGKYRRKTIPVGSLEVANAFGLYDMHGNVWEWCEDIWHGNYEGAPANGSARLSGRDSGYRILRGGSWGNGGGSCRSADRDRYDPGLLIHYTGVRVVVSLRTLSP